MRPLAWLIPFALLVGSSLALLALPKTEPRPLDESIRAATDFLLARQNPDGSFTTRFVPSAISRLGLPFWEQGAGYTHTFFTTTFVGHALTFVEQTPAVRYARARATGYVLSERNASGLWNYYGPDVRNQEMDIPEDSDDTAVALAMLAENGALLPDGLSALNTLRREDGNYWVWARPVQGQNGVECVASANVLYALSMLNYPETGGVCSYLNEMAERFRAGDTSCLRYYNYAAFAHAYSRTLKDGRAVCLEKGAPALRELLEHAQVTGGWWGSSYNTCEAITALLNTGSRWTEVTRAVQRVREAQMEDGSWPAHSWFVGPFRTFGSSETTTGFCLEALAKYWRAGGA